MRGTLSLTVLFNSNMNTERGWERLSYQNGSLREQDERLNTASRCFVKTHAVCSASLPLIYAEMAFNQWELQYVWCNRFDTWWFQEEHTAAFHHSLTRGNNWSNFFPKLIILIHFGKKNYPRSWHWLQQWINCWQCSLTIPGCHIKAKVLMTFS